MSNASGRPLCALGAGSNDPERMWEFRRVGRPRTGNNNLKCITPVEGKKVEEGENVKEHCGVCNVG